MLLKLMEACHHNRWKGSSPPTMSITSFILLGSNTWRVNPFRECLLSNCNSTKALTWPTQWLKQFLTQHGLGHSCHREHCRLLLCAMMRVQYRSDNWCSAAKPDH